jgi:hypothetical protein
MDYLIIAGLLFLAVFIDTLRQHLFKRKGH